MTYPALFALLLLVATLADDKARAGPLAYSSGLAPALRKLAALGDYGGTMKVINWSFVIGTAVLIAIGIKAALWWHREQKYT